jgi:hypothetical protein
LLIAECVKGILLSSDGLGKDGVLYVIEVLPFRGLVMYCPPVITHRIFISKIPIAGATISMACRSLVLLEGVVEIKPLVTAWATVVMDGAAVTLEALGGVEKSITVMTETVARSALVGFQSVFSAEVTGTIVAGGHDDGIGEL